MTVSLAFSALVQWVLFFQNGNPFFGVVGVIVTALFLQHCLDDWRARRKRAGRSA